MHKYSLFYSIAPDPLFIIIIYLRVLQTLQLLIFINLSVTHKV